MLACSIFLENMIVIVISRGHSNTLNCLSNTKSIVTQKVELNRQPWGHSSIASHDSCSHCQYLQRITVPTNGLKDTKCWDQITHYCKTAPPYCCYNTAPRHPTTKPKKLASTVTPLQNKQLEPLQKKSHFDMLIAIWMVFKAELKDLSEPCLASVPG